MSHKTHPYLLIIQWILTLTPTLWLITVFTESFRAAMLIGKLPGRWVALSDAEIEILKQDWLFQTLNSAIYFTFSIAAIAFLVWLPITLCLAGWLFWIARGSRFHRVLKAFIYLLLHITIFILPLIIFLFEPTRRADWLFD